VNNVNKIKNKKIHKNILTFQKQVIIMSFNIIKCDDRDNDIETYLQRVGDAENQQ